MGWGRALHLCRSVIRRLISQDFSSGVSDSALQLCRNGRDNTRAPPSHLWHQCVASLPRLVTFLSSYNWLSIPPVTPLIPLIDSAKAFMGRSRAGKDLACHESTSLKVFA